MNKMSSVRRNEMKATHGKLKSRSKLLTSCPSYYTQVLKNSYQVIPTIQQ